MNLVSQLSSIKNASNQKREVDQILQQHKSKGGSIDFHGKELNSTEMI